MTDFGARPTAWQVATVSAVRRLTPSLVSLKLELPDRLDHLPGQHYVLRLTAEDGYTAQRSYSIASAPSDPLIELCVDRLPDGEVSGFLYDVLRPGDTLEVRGPIGGFFVWDGSTPALGIGGGSGVVPIRAMLRHAQATGVTDRLALAVSARTAAELPYHDELIAAGATVALTRAKTRAEGVLDHRLAATDLAPLVPGRETAYICGSAVFAEAISRQLLSLDYPTASIKVERFGPTS